ncbi:MAG: TRAP transporter small permease subunit [Deinococcota bacterium]|jgi:TRAP-type mannitol/chloroaromatic compound transport system permease small subunit|nr:TRAP transporter small permease subunit [Deinococcota bacterium]
MKVFKSVEWIIEKLGILGAWVALPLTAVVIYQVVMRYVFHSPPIWGYDVSWMLFSVMFLLGGGYTLMHDRHVRVDILFRLLPPRWQAFVEALFFAVMFCPIMYVLAWQGVQYASRSWASGEFLSTTLWRFPAAPIKTLIPIAFVLLGVQGFIVLIRRLNYLARGEAS